MQAGGQDGHLGPVLARARAPGRPGRRGSAPVWPCPRPARSRPVRRARAGAARCRPSGPPRGVAAAGRRGRPRRVASRSRLALDPVELGRHPPERPSDRSLGRLVRVVHLVHRRVMTAHIVSVHPVPTRANVPSCSPAPRRGTALPGPVFPTRAGFGHASPVRPHTPLTAGATDGGGEGGPGPERAGGRTPRRRRPRGSARTAGSRAAKTRQTTDTAIRQKSIRHRRTSWEYSTARWPSSPEQDGDRTGGTLLLAAEGARVIVNDVGASLQGQGGANTPRKRWSSRSRPRAAMERSTPRTSVHGRGPRSLIDQAVETFGQLDILVNKPASSGTR